MPWGKYFQIIKSTNVHSWTWGYFDWLFIFNVWNVIFLAHIILHRCSTQWVEENCMKLNLITVMSLKGFQGLRMAIILSVVQFKSPINGTNLLLYNSRSICISNEIAFSRGMQYKDWRNFTRIEGVSGFIYLCACVEKLNLQRIWN